jgi:hypothetical protein
MKKYSYLLLLASAIFLMAGECMNPCKNVECVNGTCVEGICDCDDGWDGTLCDVDMCAGIDCDHGDCVDGECVCDDGWDGTLCDDCETDCGAHGACNDAGECACTDGYTGDNCQTPPTSSLCSNTCEYADDGECDDGGTGSDYSVCDCGTDCIDCGSRVAADCGGGTNAAISVWTSIVSFPCNTQKIDVYLNDVYEGFLDSYYSSEPDCGDGGTVTTEVNAGTHTLYAECNDGDTYWGPGDVTVADGYCLMLELTADKKMVVKMVKLRNDLFNK